MVERLGVEPHIQPVGMHELSPGGDGIDINLLLLQKPIIHISSFESINGTPPDIYLSHLRDELKDRSGGKNVKDDEAKGVSLYTSIPPSIPLSIGIECTIRLEQDTPILQVAIPTQTLQTKLSRSAEDKPELLERFFELLDWEDGRRPYQLRRVLPLLHQQQIVEKAETLADIMKIVQHGYKDEALHELLQLSRQVRIVDETPERISNEQAERNRQTIVYGVSGIQVDDEMIEKNEQGEIKISLRPSLLRFYSNADSLLRRELATLQVTKRSNGSFILWYIKGIEAGTFTTQTDGGRLIFAYEPAHQKTSIIVNDEFITKQHINEAAERDKALLSRLQSHLSEYANFGDDRREESVADTVVRDPLMIPRSEKTAKTGQ